MKKQLFVLMLTVLLACPVAGFAMKDMDHGKKKNQDMGKIDQADMKGMGMAMDGKMSVLGSEEVDGVKGLFHLNDVRERMAKHGMKQTHHIMVAFSNVASGEAIDSGVVAVKIEDPDEKVGKAIKLMGMDGQFGADITLDKKGMYHFKIGTKLADGKNRMYHMHFENK